MKLVTLLMQSDSSRFARKADRDITMVTEDHRHAGKKSKAKKLAEMDKELYEIRADIEKLELRMRHDKKPRWVYEWPMKEPKAKWPVKELMVRRQRRLLKGWLRHTENLNGPEEEMVQVCEPKTGRNLSEMGLVEDLKNYQEGREEIPDCQVGNELRSLRDLRDCQEDSQGISHCQLGNELRSLWDLKDCQEGSGSIPYFQVGRDESMSWDQPEELTEQMSSEMDLDQHVQLIEEEDTKNLLMIGGIGVFLPFSQEEA
jgi:hypothetical protein